MQPSRLLPLASASLAALVTPAALQADLVLVRFESEFFFSSSTTDEQYLPLTDTFKIYDAANPPQATFTVWVPTLREGKVSAKRYLYSTSPTTEITRDEPTFEYLTVNYTENDTTKTAEVIKLTPSTIKVTLLPEEQPMHVANFMTYVRNGDYTDSIVHRNPYMGLLGEPLITGGASFNIAQGGGYTMDPDEDYTVTVPEGQPVLSRHFVFQSVPSRGSITGFPESRDNARGTIAAALTSSGTASTGWYFNISDNSSTLGTNYPVFGAIDAADTSSLATLDLIGSIPATDLTQLFGFGSSTFRDLPFMVNGSGLNSTIASRGNFLWTDSFLRFGSVTLNEEAGRTPTASDAVTYGYEAAQDEDATSVNDTEAFTITADNANNRLVVKTNGVGMLLVNLMATQGTDEEELSSVYLISVKPEMGAFLPNFTGVFRPFEGDDDTAADPWEASYSSSYGMFYDYGFPLLSSPYYGWMWVSQGALTPDEERPGLYTSETNFVDGFWFWNYASAHWAWTKASHYSKWWYNGDSAADAGWIYVQQVDEDDNDDTATVPWVFIYPKVTDQTGVWVKLENLGSKTIDEHLAAANTTTTAE